jgi:hypothetical protein
LGWFELFNDLERPQHLGQVLALAEHAFAILELAHRLLAGISMSLHVVILPFQGYGYPQRMDHYPGLRSTIRRTWTV